MPTERLTMRKIREVFRQKFDCDISNRQGLCCILHLFGSVRSRKVGIHFQLGNTVC